LCAVTGTAIDHRGSAHTFYRGRSVDNARRSGETETSRPFEDAIGMEWQAWRGTVRRGVAWRGGAWLGEARQGEAGKAWPGLAECGLVGIGVAGLLTGSGWALHAAGPSPSHCAAAMRCEATMTALDDPKT
jgi:hypothetical protein